MRTGMGRTKISLCIQDSKLMTGMGRTKISLCIQDSKLWAGMGRNIMDRHGQLWTVMDRHGQLWTVMDRHGQLCRNLYRNIGTVIGRTHNCRGHS